MGDEDDGGAPLGGQRRQQLDDRIAARGVERAGRLVGKDQAALADEGPGDRDALLLTAGEVVGIPVEVWSSPTDASASSAGAGVAGATPSSSSGSITFSTAVSEGTRLRRWNT